MLHDNSLNFLILAEMSHRYWHLPLSSFLPRPWQPSFSSPLQSVNVPVSVCWCGHTASAFQVWLLLALVHCPLLSSSMLSQMTECPWFQQHRHGGSQTIWQQQRVWTPSCQNWTQGAEETVSGLSALSAPCWEPRFYCQHLNVSLQPYKIPLPGDPTPSCAFFPYQIHTWYT